MCDSNVPRVHSVAAVDTLDHAKSVIHGLRAASRAQKTLFDNNSEMPSSAMAVEAQSAIAPLQTPRMMHTPRDEYHSCQDTLEPANESQTQSPPQHRTYVLKAVSDLDSIIVSTALRKSMEEQEHRAVQHLLDQPVAPELLRNRGDATAEGYDDGSEGGQEPTEGLPELTEEEKRLAVMEFLQEEGAGILAGGSERDIDGIERPSPHRSLESRQRNAQAMAEYEQDSESDSEEDVKPAMGGSRSTPKGVKVKAGMGATAPAGMAALAALTDSASMAPKSMTQAKGVTQEVPKKSSLPEPAVGINSMANDMKKYDAIMAKINANSKGSNENSGSGSVQLSSNVLFTYTKPGGSSQKHAQGNPNSVDDSDDDDWNNSDDELDVPDVNMKSKGGYFGQFDRADSPPMCSMYDDLGAEDGTTSSGVTIGVSTKKEKNGKSKSSTQPQSQSGSQSRKPLPVAGRPKSTSSTAVGKGPGSRLHQPGKSQTQIKSKVKTNRAENESLDDWDDDMLGLDDPVDDWGLGGASSGVSFNYEEEDTTFSAAASTKNGAGGKKSSNKSVSSGVASSISFSKAPAKTSGDSVNSSDRLNLTVLTGTSSSKKNPKFSGASAKAAVTGGSASADMNRVIIKPGQAIRVKPNTKSKF